MAPWPEGACDSAHTLRAKPKMPHKRSEFSWIVVFNYLGQIALVHF